jgi:hypothetical protein
MGAFRIEPEAFAVISLNNGATCTTAGPKGKLLKASG